MVKHLCNRTTMSSQSPSPDALSSASNSDAEQESVRISRSPFSKCQLCLDVFRDPKLLSCLHSFCHQCLLQRQEQPDRIVCPVCLAETYLSSNGLSGLLTDFSVNSTRETRGVDVESFSCTSCKGKDARVIAHCFDCNNFLCGSCESAHRLMHCFERHHVFDVGEMSKQQEVVIRKTQSHVKCPKHVHENLIYFCCTCDMPVCKECTMIDHGRMHECYALNEIGGNEVQKLQQLADLAKARAIDLRGSAKDIDVSSIQLQQQYQKIKADVNDIYTYARTLLDDHRSQLLKELDSAYSDKRLALGRVAQEMQEVVIRLQQACEFINKLTKCASPTEILLFKKMLSGKLNTVINYVPDMEQLKPCNVEFVSNPMALQSAIQNAFGHMRQHGADMHLIGKRTGAPDTGKLYQNGFQTTNGLAYQNGFSSHDTLSAFPDHGSALPGGNGFLDQNGEFPAPKSFPEISTFTCPESSYGGDIGNKPQAFDTWSNPPVDIFTMADVFTSDEQKSKPVSSEGAALRSQVQRQKMVYHSKFGEFGSQIGQFTEPSGVAVSAEDDIYVADTNNHRIQIFDHTGEYKYSFGTCGKRDGQLLYPNRIAINRLTGDVVITERSPTHQVQIFSKDGVFIRKFGANILQHPRGITVDNQGRIIVVECKVMRVIIFDQMGNVLFKFGCSKNLEFPNGIVVNDKEEIFISDNRAHCVKVFSYRGEFLRQIGGEGITNYPIGVGINRAGEILIADNHNNFNVTVFSQDGQMVKALESKVKHAQCFDVAVMDEGSIVLASKDFRIYVYRYDGNTASLTNGFY